MSAIVAPRTRVASRHENSHHSQSDVWIRAAAAAREQRESKEREREQKKGKTENNWLEHGSRTVSFVRSSAAC